MDETHMRQQAVVWLIRLPFRGDRRHPWHGSEAAREKAMEVFARSWHANRKKLPLPHPAQDQPHDGRAGASYERGEMQSENQSPVAAFLFFAEHLP